ncbi:hypothetical protein QUD55_07890 [Lactococcus lactis]|uniref:hypothetical protein n=1 Tax=Lactococcus lactis TaxID=1358 RepID=UPI0025A06961|nr:hypothetical protein [Lactococcus lactis]MDM7537392.1 hypothetical protein [Lactococcus lactis]
MADITKIIRGMQNGAETIDNNFSKMNTELEKTVKNVGDETISGKKKFSGDVSVDGDFTMKKFADSYVAIFSSKSTPFEITAPWDCTAEVEYFFHAWGYSGGEWEIGISAPSSLTKIYEATGYTNGHDSQGIAMPTKAAFSGLKSGQKYTFDKRDVSGKPGGGKLPTMIVKLYRN